MGGVTSVGCPGGCAARGQGPGQRWEQVEARGGSRPLTAALCCVFCSPRLRAEFREDLLMRQEVGLSLEAG